MPPNAKMEPTLARPGRPKPWRVTQAATISPTGKKRHRWFRSKELAAAWVRDEEKRLRSYSDKAREFTDEEKLVYAEALPICRQWGFTVLEAVREKAARVEQERASVTLETLVEEAVAQLVAEEKSVQHVNNAYYVGKKFVAAFPGLLACDVTTEGLQAWFESIAKHLRPATLKQHRRYISLILEHGRRSKYLTGSPAKDVRLAYRDDSTVSTLTPEQTRRLLTAADPLVRPYIALCAFQGLRPAEAQRLAWNNVTDTHIFVSAAIAKTRKNRVVPISENLLPWIAAARGRGGHVFHSLKLFREAVEDAGLAPWPQDCLRHSYGTYRLALTKNEQTVAADMGNSPDIIHKHYRKPVTPEVATAFFSITDEDPTFTQEAQSKRIVRNAPGKDRRARRFVGTDVHHLRSGGKARRRRRNGLAVDPSQKAQRGGRAQASDDSGQ